MTDSSGAEIGEKPAPASRIDIERPSVLAANVLLCTLPVVVLILIPMLVKGLVETLGLSEREAGFVATSQTLGYTTGTLVAYFAVGHCNWRKAATVSLAAVLIANLASTGATTFETLLVVRFGSGIGGGALVAITLAAIAQMREPERGFGLWLVSQSAFSAVGMRLFPTVLHAWGLPGAFAILAGLALLGFSLLRFVPERALAPSREGQIVSSRGLGLAWWGIGAGLLFEFGLMAPWTYVERIGAAAGLDESAIATSLGASALCGVVGGLAAVRLGSRFGRLPPVLGSAVLSCGALALLMSEHLGFWSYAIACGGIFGLWSFAFAYLLGALAAGDPSGRATTLGNGAIGIGLVAGPLTGALVVGDGSYDAILVLGMFLMLASVLAFLPLARRLDE
jgi:predicted MFS family arabinose efflux permease